LIRAPQLGCGSFVNLAQQALLPWRGGGEGPGDSMPPSPEKFRWEIRGPEIHKLGLGMAETHPACEALLGSAEGRG